MVVVSVRRIMSGLFVLIGIYKITRSNEWLKNIS